MKEEDVCICTDECDCQNPDPDDGVALLSNECPIHNLFPSPDPKCKAKKHKHAL